MTEILVLYYSQTGATAALAREVALGVDAVSSASARLRTVPPVSALCERVADAVPADGPPYAETRDVRDCAGLVMGSPAYFGNMAAPLKYFLDSTVDEWFATAFVGKPAGVFTSSGSLHGGQESALLSMMLPLLHHGFFIVGLPYTDKALSATRSGGTPYGASHVTWNRADDSLSQDERTLARQLGGRVASLALQLAD